MRSLPLVSLLGTAAVLCGCQHCTDPTPWPEVVEHPLGAPCSRASQCAAGLDCIDSTCTVPCADGACPPGATCFDRRHCLRSCAGDEDCQLGVAMGSCNLLGAGQPYCFPRSCHSDAECVAGTVTGRCAGLSEARGVTWNDWCTTGTCVQ
jgi:hypothetical protein